MTTPQLQKLLQIVRQLRDPHAGCPWDRAQTFASLAPYTLEEACEVVDVLERGDLSALREELGDLLFQVVLLSRMAEEGGAFDFDSVAGAIADKLVRRHPHVFGEVAAGHDVAVQWEQQKAEEREARGDKGVLADIPRSLPALLRASKLGRRAGRVGFDWNSASGARDKVLEELREVDAAVANGDAAGTAEEIGDLLLAVSSWARHLKLDPESCLRAANAKFERRFGYMECLADQRGLDLPSLSAEEWEGLWNEARKAVQS